MIDNKTFYRDGKIYYGDNPAEPVAFVVNGFCDIFHGMYDACISLYTGMFGAVGLPREANQIRLYYNPCISNWCWGKYERELDDLFIYRAIRGGADGSSDKFLYLYDLRDNYIYRYPVPDNIWLMRWLPEQKVFEVVTGGWDNPTATVKNAVVYIIRPPEHPHKTNGISPDIQLVECQTPECYRATEPIAAPKPEPAPVPKPQPAPKPEPAPRPKPEPAPRPKPEPSPKREPMPEALRATPKPVPAPFKLEKPVPKPAPSEPETPKSPIPGFYIIPGSFASRHPRTAFACVFIGGAIMFALMIIGIIRSIMALF